MLSPKEPVDARHLILDEEQVARKIRRIAHEIYEQNFNEPYLALIGIQDTGYDFAQQIYEELKRIASFELTLVCLKLDKSVPVQTEIQLSEPVAMFEGQAVVIIDDVLNTGRTLAYSLKPFLQLSISKLQIAVLVDREHRAFPIAADFVGYSLSTTINQHVEVMKTSGGEFRVYLH